VRVRQEWDGVVPGDTWWSLGWGLTSVDGEMYLWHWGWNNGFKSFATASRATRNGVVVLTNGDNGLWVCKAIVTELAGAEHPAFPWLGHG
jgi:CubicO group peptidase (beta-lactamase class C family)